MSIFKNEIERKIFNRMISVFGLDDISEKRFMNAIDNPEIVIPDELQGILTEENDYRYVLNEDINNLKFDALDDIFDYKLLENNVAKFINKNNNIGADKLLNYKVVISKNIKDFIFCSSTGGFSSCYSLFSEYEGAAWSGIPTIYMQKSRVIFMIVKDLDDTVNVFDIDTVKIRARAWGFIRGKTIYLSKYYGDYDLMVEKIELVKDEIIKSIIPVEYTGICVPFIEKINPLYDMQGRALFPYFDVEKIKERNGDYYVEELTYDYASDNDFMPYDDGTSFEYIYEDSYYDTIGEYNDRSYNDDEDENDEFCELCEEYVSEVRCVDVDGRRVYACENCVDELAEIRGEYYHNNFEVIILRNLFGDRNYYSEGLFNARFETKGMIEISTKVIDEIEELENKSLYEKLLAIEGELITVPEIDIHSGGNYSNLNTIINTAGFIIAVSEDEKMKIQEDVNIPEDKKVNNAKDKNVVLLLGDNGDIYKFYLLVNNKIAFENVLTDNELKPEMYIRFAALIAELANIDIDDVIDIGFNTAIPALFVIPKQYYYSYYNVEYADQQGILKVVLDRFNKDNEEYINYGVKVVVRY